MTAQSGYPRVLKSLQRVVTKDRLGSMSPSDGEPGVLRSASREGGLNGSTRSDLNHFIGWLPRLCSAHPGVPQMWPTVPGCAASVALLTRADASRYRSIQPSPCPIRRCRSTNCSISGGGRRWRAGAAEERELFGPSRHLPAGGPLGRTDAPQHSPSVSHAARGHDRRRPCSIQIEGIDQDHRRARRGRRRRGGVVIGNRPPRSASRWALARAIKASRPAWISAVFSTIPVSSRARAILSSSRLRVVRICIKYASSCRPSLVRSPWSSRSISSSSLLRS